MPHGRASSSFRTFMRSFSLPLRIGDRFSTRQKREAARAAVLHAPASSPHDAPSRAGIKRQRTRSRYVTARRRFWKSLDAAQHKIMPNIYEYRYRLAYDIANIISHQSDR